MGSMGPGVQWDPVTENHVVPVHREMCKYTIIPSSPGPIEHRVPLNPLYIPLLSGGMPDKIGPLAVTSVRDLGEEVQVEHIRLTLG